MHERRYSSVAVMPVCQHQPLDGGAYFCLRSGRLLPGPMSIKAGLAHSCQFAHAVDAQLAMRSHPGTDTGLETVSPALLIAASTLIIRKALSKKSNSSNCPPTTIPDV